MTFDYQICDSDKCTGCFACMNKCPKSAITCGVDKIGRTLPVIDKERCVRCGICLRTCPVNNPYELQEPRSCYAAQRKNKEDREQSSSGGIAAVLSEYVISTGGSVFGAAVDEKGKVCHICAKTKEQIDRLRGSKYVQSDIGFCFRDVERELKEGRKVLFVGTPCQVSGLKHYIGKDNENLYCVDLICHGVPPMQYLKEHYDTVAGEKEIDRVSFRNPSIGFCLSIQEKGQTIYTADRFHDTYFHSFFHALTYRENCYQCSYAERKRCSDMTIGDFWGIDRKSLKNIKSGYISVALINSQKGQELFEKIKAQLNFEERAISEAVAGNKQLQVPSIKHKLRDQFLNSYENTKNFDEAIEHVGIVREMRIESIKGKIDGLKNKVIWKLNSVLR